MAAAQEVLVPPEPPGTQAAAIQPDVPEPAAVEASEPTLEVCRTSSISYSPPRVLFSCCYTSFRSIFSFALSYFPLFAVSLVFSAPCCQFYMFYLYFPFLLFALNSLSCIYRLRLLAVFVIHCTFSFIRPALNVQPSGFAGAICTRCFLLLLCNLCPALNVQPSRFAGAICTRCFFIAL